MDLQNKENLQKILNEFENTELSLLNIMDTLLKLMKKVETISNLKGEEKKRLVLEAIEFLLKKSKLDETFLKVLPDLIDSIISVEKGEIKIKESISKNFLCCFKGC
jgi:replicative superfamily II helicase